MFSGMLIGLGETNPSWPSQWFTNEFYHASEIHQLILSVSILRYKGLVAFADRKIRTHMPYCLSDELLTMQQKLVA